MFQPIYKMFTAFDGLPYKITEWKSKGLSNEQIKLPVAANHSLSPKLIWMSNLRIRRQSCKLKGSCLKEDKVTFTQRNKVNSFIAYDLIHGHKI